LQQFSKKSAANRTIDINISDQGTDCNVLEGNDVGTDFTGLANVGNLGDAVDV
jgi:hypothetical protein